MALRIEPSGYTAHFTRFSYLAAPSATTTTAATTTAAAAASSNPTANATTPTMVTTTSTTSTAAPAVLGGMDGVFSHLPFFVLGWQRILINSLGEKKDMGRTDCEMALRLFGWPFEARLRPIRMPNLHLCSN